MWPTVILFIFELLFAGSCFCCTYFRDIRLLCMPKLTLTNVYIRLVLIMRRKCAASIGIIPLPQNWYSNFYRWFLGDKYKITRNITFHLCDQSQWRDTENMAMHFLPLDSWVVDIHGHWVITYPSGHFCPYIIK